MSSLLALARANVRYWPSVAPAARGRLSAWRRRALLIAEPRRRALALGKLRAERFNPQLAATLATQAPRADRPAVLDAILATQIAYDYRDALQERGLALADGYTAELDRALRAALARLPGWSAVADVAAAGAQRCAEAQRRGHAALAGGDGELRRWAELQAAGSGLGWPEWLAGAQASVLGTHALIALAADGAATRGQAVALDRLYLSIGALSMLDSLIDRAPAMAAHELGYERWYGSHALMGERLAAAVGDARGRAGRAPNGSHHLMTLSGVVAYYATAPQARARCAREALAPVRAELGPLLTPALALMRAWRLGERAHRRLTPLARVAFGGAAVGGAVLAGAALGGVALGGAPRARAALGGAARADGAPPARVSLAMVPLARAARGGPPIRARAAHSLRASDDARLRYVSASGSTVYETGRATGTLPGPMHVHMRIAATFTGSFTIYAAGGSIRGHGSATPHGSGVYESFAGSLTVTGGSGRFRRAHGSARLYGTFNRGSYALLIQTRGTLLF